MIEEVEFTMFPDSCKIEQKPFLNYRKWNFYTVPNSDQEYSVEKLIEIFYKNKSFIDTEISRIELENLLKNRCA